MGVWGVPTYIYIYLGPAGCVIKVASNYIFRLTCSGKVFVCFRQLVNQLERAGGGLIYLREVMIHCLHCVFRPYVGWNGATPYLLLTIDFSQKVTMKHGLINYC